MTEYTVSQITNNIKEILKSSLCNSFYVTGEVSNKRMHQMVTYILI